MAILNKSVLGKVLGSIGNLTFKQRNGKNYISLKPESYPKCNKQVMVLIREKFALVSKIAKVINNNPVLYSIWRNHTRNGMSVYNNIVKSIYPYFRNKISPDSIRLLPAGGFKVQKSSIFLDNKNLKLGINPQGINYGIDVSKELFVSLYSIIYLNRPKTEGEKKSHFFLVNSEPEVFILNETINFSIMLPGVWESLYEKYEEKEAVFILVTSDLNGLPVRYSEIFI